MFGWLNWGKPVHPMADVKMARQLVAELPAHDLAKALDKIATWLASINRTGEPVRRRSAVLLSVATDKNNEALVLTRASHFTTTHNLSMHLEDKLYLLLPTELIEGGEDFDCARFKVMPA